MQKKYLSWLPWLILVLAVVIDQIIKFYIKLNFLYGESYDIFSWFKICFVENPGMAFGLTIGSKVLLTTFRIVVSGLIIWYIYKLIKERFDMGYIIVITLLLAGALGNLVDCIFYGVIFSESTPFALATLFPDGGGYATIFTGKVVDMLYFPLFRFPSWVPFFGGEIFFGPIFNFADCCVTSSVFALIIFCKKRFSASFELLWPDKKTKQENK